MSKDREISKLKSDIAKLRMGLKFYADERKYSGEHGAFWQIVTDKGRTARRFLEETGQ